MHTITPNDAVNREIYKWMERGTSCPLTVAGVIFAEMEAGNLSWNTHIDTVLRVARDTYVV